VRVALISDLHGNLVSLDAVLEDAARVGVDRLVCLGDVATLGPRPSEVIERLSKLGCDCILGNHDEFLLDDELIRRYTEVPIVVDSVSWARDLLSTAELSFVRGFARSVEIPLEGGATLFLFHGSPRSHMEDLLAETPPARVDELLDGRHATVMAGGHTHLQMLRQHRGILLVNPGSVGMPFKEHTGGKAPVLLPHAEYAIVESDRFGVSVNLRRVAVDRAALRASVAGCSMPLAPMLAQQYSI
jgi:predicted phosphodiesterase